MFVLFFVFFLHLINDELADSKYPVLFWYLSWFLIFYCNKLVKYEKLG